MDTNEEDDIYSDLPNFKYHETLDKLQATNKALQNRVAELEEQVEILTKENIDYKTKCKNLSTNISSVLKTAQTEIKRKDGRIKELNREIISLKTRSFRPLRKRNLSRSPNEANINSKKMKISDLKDSPLSLRHSCKGSPSNISIDSPLRENVPSRVRKLPFTENEIEKPMVTNEPEIKQRVPNINCPTVYSQRMFKKIYNADPINKIAHDYGSSLNETDIPSSLEHVEKTSESVGPSKVSDTEKEFKDSSECKPPSLDNPSVPDVINITNNSILTSTNITVCNKEPTVHNIDKPNTSNELVNNSKTQSAPNNEAINDEFNLCNRNTKDKASDTHSIPNLPSDMLEISKNISAKDLESIISNVQSFNFIDGNTIKQSIDKALIPEKSANEVVKNSPKPVKKTDNSNNKISDTFGLKLTNRSNKTIFHPISCNWANTFQNKCTSAAPKPLNISSQIEEKDEHSEKTDVIEALFGSPLKWTENSSDDLNQVPKLNPPSTAYEDSCSAQIENSKFKKLAIETSKVMKNISIKTSDTVTNSSAILLTTSNQPKQHSSPSNAQVFTEVGRNEEAPPRLFEQIKGDKNDTRTFSPFVNLTRGSEPFNVPSLSLKVDEAASRSPRNSRLFNPPKYNDSILGQFDDTTQLISALARDHSKISPIHTPIKESKTEAVSSSPDSKTYASKDENLSTKSDNTPLLVSPPVAVKKLEKRTILLEKPINILRPRKTPRLVSGNKPPPCDSPYKLNNSTNPEKTFNSNTETSTANVPLTSCQQSAVKTSNIKLSSVSHEVIVRAKAINLGRKYKYTNTKLKCKIKERNHRFKEKDDKSEKCSVSEIQSQQAEHIEMENILPSKQTNYKEEQSSVINGQPDSTRQIIKETSMAQDSTVNLSTNESHTSNSFHQRHLSPPEKTDDPISYRKDIVTKNIMQNTFPPRIVEHLQISGKEQITFTPSNTSQISQDLTNKALHNSTRSPENPNVDTSRLSDSKHILNRNGIASSKKENIVMASKTDHGIGALSKIISSHEKNTFSLKQDDRNKNTTPIRSNTTKILELMMPNYKSHLKHTGGSERVDTIKLMNTRGSKAELKPTSTPKRENSSSEFLPVPHSNKINEKNPNRTHRDSSLEKSHSKKDNHPIKSSKLEASSQKKDNYSCRFERKDLTSRALEKRELLYTKGNHPYSSSKDKQHSDPISSYASLAKKESDSNRSKRAEAFDKLNRSNYSLKTNDNSPTLSKKGNNDSVPSNSSSSAKKENSPIKIQRVERDTKRTSNFKRPNNNFSRFSENCRFRHSSVERKLLKDHRLSSRARMTPVRVVKRHRQDPRSSSTHRSHSKENKNNHHSKSYKASPSKLDNDACKLSTSKSFQSHCIDSKNRPVGTSPFQLPTVPIRKTTHIKRTSRKIDWCSTTSDVVSTKSVECTALTTPKPETKMKWFLQPIDFNVTHPSAHSNSVDMSNRSKEYISSPSGSDCKSVLQGTSINTIDNTPEKTPKKSPNIVIVARRRPAKFGVSEISIHSTKCNET